MPTQCKDGDGKIIIQNGKILEIWKEYFRNLFEVDGKTTDPITLESIVDDNQEITPPTFNEICSIINKLKNNKAAGSDNICPELIKYGGRALKYKMYRLIPNIWDKEQLPEQWREGIICPIYKKR
jgi:hypothetical protein